MGYRGSIVWAIIITITAALALATPLQTIQPSCEDPIELTYHKFCDGEVGFIDMGIVGYEQTFLNDWPAGSWEVSDGFTLTYDGEGGLRADLNEPTTSIYELSLGGQTLPFLIHCPTDVRDTIGVCLLDEPTCAPWMAESCNGLDDDCDGEIDEDWSQLGEGCMVGVGACSNVGSWVCAQDGSDAVCSAEPGEPSPEVCDDLIDNDCDGYTDGDDSDCGVQQCSLLGAPTYRFDMDDESDLRTADGWTSVARHVYGDGQPWGWDARFVSMRSYAHADAMLNDYHYGSFDGAARTFSADLADGTYQVIIHMQYAPAGHPRESTLDISAEGDLVRDDLSIEAWQRYKEAFTVDVRDGTIDIGFAEDGPGNLWLVNGIEIYPVLDSAVQPCCGDGVLDDGEVCDDGNNVGGDGCSPDCAEQAPFCLDADFDGYYAQSGCKTPVDCNERDDTINPGADEICDNGRDDDCDGLVDRDDPACEGFHPLCRDLREVKYRFDFDGVSRNTSAGWTSVYDELYDTGLSWGWENRFYHTREYANADTMLGDFHFSAFDGAERTFRVDLPNGLYEIVLHWQFKPAGLPRSTTLDVLAEGELVLDDVELDVWRRYQDRFDVRVIDGTLDITFAEDGETNLWFINGIEIYPIAGLNPSPCCGDGVLDDGEVCDDGNNLDGDACSANCNQSTPFCEDGDFDGFFGQDGCGTEVDCLDRVFEVNPDAREHCSNGRDDDCDGLVDEEDPECSGECVMELTKTDSPDVVRPGDRLDYTLTLTNVGTAECTGGGVLVRERYDERTTFINATPEPTTDDDLWNFGTMQPGDTRTIEIAMRIDERIEECNDIVNEACFWTAEYDRWVCIEENTTLRCEGDSYCGDGIINQPTEQCDDGNDIERDGCSNECLIENLTCVEAKDAGLLGGHIDGAEGFVWNEWIQSYEVGLAVYEKYDEIIDNQRLFDADTDVVGADDDVLLEVELPDCAYQIDLFCGEVLESLDGQRYGERKIDWEHAGGPAYCEEPTFCGDGIKQTPNDAGTGGPADDGYEECDGTDGLIEGYTCSASCELVYTPTCDEMNITGPRHDEQDITWIDTATELHLSDESGEDVCAGTNHTFTRITPADERYCRSDCVSWTPSDPHTQEWTPYNGPFKPANESCHIIERHTRDAQGMPGAVTWDCLFVDKSPPQTLFGLGVPSATRGNATYIALDTPLVLTANDPQPHPSGLASISYRITQLHDEAACRNQTICAGSEGEGNWTAYARPFRINEESCHLIEYYAQDNVLKTEEMDKQCFFVDATKPSPSIEVGEPSQPMSDADRRDGAHFFEQLDPRGENVCVEEGLCAEVTMLTPIELRCDDAEPHPSGTGEVCFTIELDGIDATEYYCDGRSGGELREGGCCVADDVSLLFKETSWHRINLTCEDAVGNAANTTDTLYAKVQGEPFTIKLYKKWNLISIPFALSDDAPEALFGELEHVDSVWGWDAREEDWRVWSPHAPSDLERIMPGEGYWVLMRDDEELPMQGSLLRPGVTPPEKPLYPGWNLIGYYGTQWEPLNASWYADAFCPDDESSYRFGANTYCALNSLATRYDDVQPWNSLWGYTRCGTNESWRGPSVCAGDGWLEPENMLFAGKGYWINVDAPTVYGPVAECEWSPMLSCSPDGGER